MTNLIYQWVPVTKKLENATAQDFKLGDLRPELLQQLHGGWETINIVSAINNAFGVHSNDVLNIPVRYS